MLGSDIVCLSVIHVISRSQESDRGRVFQVGGCITEDNRIILGVRKNLPIARTAGQSTYQAGFVVVVYVEPVTPLLTADGAHAALVVHEGLIFARPEAVGAGHTGFV
jgi:hypothetical protein